MTEPTAPMRKEAISAGYYETEYGQFSRIRILTIEDLFEGKRPPMPWIDTTPFKKAKREAQGRQQDLFKKS
ncbi:MAG: hypothetical protein H6923_08045 [Alphaproteobacteria bacterium]|nr:hypothetical protein [Alphaproteobacteria bacterium]